MSYFNQLPPWAQSLLWSAVALLAAYLIGRFLTRTIGQRLRAWAAKTPHPWDDLLIEALQRGVPLWSALIGLYIVLGFWNLPFNLLSILTRAIYVLIWLSVTLITAGLAGRLIALYSKQFGQALPGTSLTQNIAQILVVIVGALMILNGLGVSITPLLAALGVGGLAVALALQDTLANLFAGFYMTVARQVRVGDYVKLDTGQEGYVEDIGWRATLVRMLSNNMVLVPNKTLGESTIVNYYLPSRELAVLVEVGVDYASDLAHVERVTCEVGREVMQTVTGGVPAFEPFIRYHTFGESSVNFTVILRGKEFVDQYLVKHEFIKRLHARYAKEGIVIPFPIRTVHLHQEAARA